MDQNEQKLCIKHNLEIVLVDLEANIVYGSRFLCIRCIIEKMNMKKIKFIDETKHLIKEMNNNEMNKKIEYNNQRLKIFNTIKSQLRELKQNLDSVFEKIFNNIDSKLSKIQSEGAIIQQQSIIINFEEDIERLSQFQECQSSEQHIHFMQNDQKLVESIDMELKSFINSDQYKKLMSDSFIFIEKNKQQDKSNTEEFNKILEQKLVLEKQNKEKDENICKLNETIESIGKQNQYLSLQLKNPIYLKLCQIVTSQYQRELTFSQINKHIVCVISQNGKQVENGAYCLCDQVIPKVGVTLFAFKIIALVAQCYIGIGIKEIIENNNYHGNLGIGYGSYTINSSKYCFSHHDKAREAKVLSFEFSINDIILVEVDIQNKTIKWTKANTNQSLTINIDTTYDLYPCLWVQQSSGNGNKVQILESLE